MNEVQAAAAVVKMFAGHGVTKPPEVVGELAAEVISSACHSCAKAVLEDSRTQGSKPLTVPAFLAVYRRTYDSPTHQFHIGQDESQVDVGKLEASYRRDDVRALVDAGMERDRAEIASAMRWANGESAASMAGRSSRRKRCSTASWSPPRSDTARGITSRRDAPHRSWKDTTAEFSTSVRQ